VLRSIGRICINADIDIALFGMHITTGFQTDIQENEMGKYFLAWILGVPTFVLVLIYLIFGR
jgi:hypothetical protein